MPTLLRPGDRLAGYQIGRHIGTGSSAEVHGRPRRRGVSVCASAGPRPCHRGAGGDLERVGDPAAESGAGATPTPDHPARVRPGTGSSAPNPDLRDGRNPAMSPFDPKKAKPVLVTTTGVEVLVHGVDYTEPEEDAEVPPPDPIPTAIVFPPGQSIADRNAFIEGLEEEWGPFITRRLDRQDINAESAKELRQEALVILFLEYDKNKGPPENVVAFLDKVLVNLICNHGRLARVKARAGDDAEAVPTLAPDPEQAVGHAELWHKMKGYVGRLSKEEAEVFEARELHGIAFEAIARAVDRPLDTVAKQHVRALEKLRAMARASERPAALQASLPSSARGSRK